MLKKFLQLSSLASLLAMAAILPAAAHVNQWRVTNEEDRAAPAGSFTSDMAIPMRARGLDHYGDRRDHDFRFFRHHARMDGRPGMYNGRHFD